MGIAPPTAGAYTAPMPDTPTASDPPPAPASGHAAAILCPRCGYDLRARTALRCPECGQPIPGYDRPLIPWIEPAGRGRLAALLATVWLVLRRPRIIAAAVAHPVRDAHTRGFQLALVVWAWLWTLATFALAGVLEPGLLNLISGRFGWPLWLAEALGWLLLLMLGTSAVTLAFENTDDPEHARRCRAVARFAAAPLLAAPLPLMLMLAATLVMLRIRTPAATAFGGFVFVLGLATWLAIPVAILQRAAAFGRHMVHSPRRRLAGLLGVVALWLLLAGLLLVALPGIVLYLCIIFGSLG